MSKQVKIRKSSRHIFKIPFEIPIKMYNPRIQNHRKLAELGMECHNLAKKTVKEIIEKDNNNLSKIKLQNALKLTLRSSLKQIDEIFQLELN